ncbi:hypothetical protein DBR40_23475 [Pedobacter sp. KBW01]|uniref:helix-turn-helix transcriptional regulator n=1 Tax=Pedobacter sp. KBW01 TaxID=2153364 RepID=UPI000F5AF82A|nr:AraC family transcriptional regulator [Pedobacter sp. KBW01]RQO65514.1 hypothetical protein DBR40_23475 [Pedobacter sp. KBW01]
MTQSGEELTLKGEYKHDIESVFSFNKAIAFSYIMDVADRKKIEIRMSHPDDEQLEVFQMIFVLKGNVTVHTSDAPDKVNISVHQHNLCRVAIQSVRMVMSDSSDEVVCINLSAAFLNRYVPVNHPAHRRLMAVRTGKEAPVILSPVNLSVTPEIGTILQRLSDAAQSNFCDQLLLESKVIELLALQLGQFEQLQSSIGTPKLKTEELERMQEAREILIHHVGEKLSLRTLAHLVGTNEFNLKRDFKTVFGNTVYGYLNQFKMEKARSILLAKDITIAEIAKKVGYKHATHFTSAFKKYFGYLPNKIKAGKLSLLIFMEDIIVLFDNLFCAIV